MNDNCFIDFYNRSWPGVQTMLYYVSRINLQQLIISALYFSLPEAVTCFHLNWVVCFPGGAAVIQKDYRALLCFIAFHIYNKSMCSTNVKQKCVSEKGQNY